MSEPTFPITAEIATAALARFETGGFPEQELSDGLRSLGYEFVWIYPDGWREAWHLRAEVDAAGGARCDTWVLRPHGLAQPCPNPVPRTEWVEGRSTHYCREHREEYGLPPLPDTESDAR